MDFSEDAAVCRAHGANRLVAGSLSRSGVLRRGNTDFCSRLANQIA
jgi:hypothetical protein